MNALANDKVAEFINENFTASYLKVGTFKIVGGAKQLQIWRDGRPVLNLALANTPSVKELAACVSEGD